MGKHADQLKPITPPQQTSFREADATAVTAGRFRAGRIRKQSEGTRIGLLYKDLIVRCFRFLPCSHVH